MSKKKCLFFKKGVCNRLSTIKYSMELFGWKFNYWVCEKHEKKTIFEIRKRMFNILEKQNWSLKELINPKPEQGVEKK